MEKSLRSSGSGELITRKSRAEPDDFAAGEDAGLRQKPKRSGTVRQSPSSLCLLNRLQKTGLVGRRPSNACTAVRQRLVAASHQARGAMPPDSRGSSTGTHASEPRCAAALARSTETQPSTQRSDDPKPWRPTHAHALLVHRKEAHPQELRQARERPAGAVPARDAARVVPRVPAGRHAPDGAQERGPAGRVHVDLPDLEPLRQRAARVRELLAAAAGVRRRRMPAARPHVLLGAARQGAARASWTARRRRTRSRK